MAVITGDTQCGIGTLKNNRSLQKCAGLVPFTALVSLIALGVVGSYAYMSSMQTTSQTVFSFSSTDIGVWYAMFEVGSILSNVFSSYFLSNKHIPRVLTLGLLMVATGCMLHGLPHFFFDYRDKIKDTDEEVTADDHITQSLCQASTMLMSTVGLPNNTTTDAAEDRKAAQNLPVTILYCIGGLLMGLGYAPYYCLSFVYIDNNVKDVHDTSKYVSAILACYTVGPVVGFGAGALFLKIYVTLGETYLTETDSQWLGAYWMGYLIFTGYLLLFVPLLVLFPKTLPSSTQAVDNNVEGYVEKISAGPSANMSTFNNKLDTEDSEKDRMEEQTARNILGLFKTIGRLLMNPLFMLIMAANCTAVYYTSGWIGFLPKYFETQFNFSASMSSVYGGALPPLFGAVAVFLGGYLTSKYKLSLQRNVIFLCIATGIGAIFLIPTHFLQCEQFPVQELSFNSTSCVSLCNCDKDKYVPLCYDSVSYKSPCVVGCDGYTTVGEKIHYTGCLCELNITMVDGICQPDTCKAPYIYMVFAILSMASVGCCASVGINIIMRSVEKEDRSFALGIQSSLASLLGWIPSPILYGVVIDSVCNIWEHPNSQKDRGYCMEYFNGQYKTKYLGLTLGTLAMTSILCAIAIPVSYMKRYKILEKIEEETELTLAVGEKSDSNTTELKTST